MTSKQILLLLATAICLSSFSCNNDDTEISTPNEVITTLNYILTPNNGGDPVTLSFRDLDGVGGDDPFVLGGTLAANQRYTGRIEVLNESVIPAEDVTTVIEEESTDHQLFYSSSISGLAITYGDSDDNGNRFGLVSNLTTSVPGVGNLTVTLKHEPDKFAAGVASGDVTNAGGSTDIEAVFAITVQ